MNRVQPIYDITQSMKELLVQDILSKKRDTVIKKLNDLILQRGKYIEALNTPYTEEEKQLGEKLLPLDNHVQQKMQTLFTELKVEMKQVKKQKSSNNKYVNPYKNVQVMDGMYMDKKK